MDITPYLMAGPSPLYIEDAFSTNLYTGNNTAQTITTGIDLTGAASGNLMQGGLLWHKIRSSSGDHYLVDTLRGANSLSTSVTTAQQVVTGSVPSSTGFTSMAYASGATAATWTFRRAARFFDIVTWTGDGAASRAIPHSLGVAPGMIIVKRTNAAENWRVYHRSLASGFYLNLDGTAAALEDTTNVVFTHTAPTATAFTVGNNTSTNAAASTYVAYIFGHDSDPGGVIQCGSYVGNGSAAGPDITLGWEPQYILLKNSSAVADWFVFDAARGLPTVGGLQPFLSPNTTAAEPAASANGVNATATGFKIATTGAFANTSGNTYIYVAIRRGPMRRPTSGTQVMSLAAATAGTSSLLLTNPATNVRPDMVLWRPNRTTVTGTYVVDLLRGYTPTSPYLITSSFGAESTPTATPPYAYRSTSQPSVELNHAGSSVQFGYVIFSRAPGFFDQVCYTGTEVAGRTIPHNLGAVPSMVWFKSRQNSGDWIVWHNGVGNANIPSQYFKLNTTDVAQLGSISNSEAFTDSYLKLSGTLLLNQAGATYTAYLFGDVPGVSKAGTYLSDPSGTSVTCGFSPRLLFIKSVNGTNNWAWYDTARGLGSSFEPELLLNSTAVETSSGAGTLVSAISVNSTGFTAQTAASAVNTSGTAGSRQYLYWACA